MTTIYTCMCALGKHGHTIKEHDRGAGVNGPAKAEERRSAGPPELGLPSQILTRLQAESKAGTKKEE